MRVLHGALARISTCLVKKRQSLQVKGLGKQQRSRNPPIPVFLVQEKPLETPERA
jgi:hypothetical protein